LVFCGVALAFFLFWFFGRVDNRKHARRFEKLAAALGVAVRRVDEFDSRFEITSGQRTFEMRQALISRSTGRSSSSLWKVFVSTPLSKRWEYHDLQVRTLGRVGGWLVSKMLRNRTIPTPAPSDASTTRVSLSDDFGTRFSIREQGTLPPNWMTDSVRQAIRAIYDDSEITVLTTHSTLEACEGRLSFVADEPDKMQAISFNRLLAHLSTLADALVAAAERSDRFGSMND
jgi:hypothetical protein